MLSFLASSYAYVITKNYKPKSNAAKIKMEKAVKKSVPNLTAHCDTYHSSTDDGIIYICYSNILCQPSFTVPCANLPGGGSVTIGLVYPQ